MTTQTMVRVARGEALRRRVLGGCAAGLTSLMLASCAGNGQNGVPLGQVLSMVPGATGGEVAIDVVRIVDKNQNFKRSESAFTTTQPSLSFSVTPQSLGFTLSSLLVEVQDSAGVRYAGAGGRYEFAANARISGGFVCPDGTDKCAYTLKTPVARSVAIPSLSVISNEVGSQLTRDCEVGDCPVLKMKLNITFKGVDDLGRSQSLTLNAASLDVRINSNTTRTE